MPKLNSLNEIGKLIRDGREKKNYTQQYLGLRLGRTKSWVSKAEQGKINLDGDTIDQIAALLNWDQEQTGQVKKAVYGVRGRHESRRETLLENIRNKFVELRQDNPNSDISETVVLAFQVMKPLPSVDFLQFVDDALIQAIKLAGEGRLHENSLGHRAG